MTQQRKHERSEKKKKKKVNIEKNPSDILQVLDLKRPHENEAKSKTNKHGR